MFRHVILYTGVGLSGLFLGGGCFIDLRVGSQTRLRVMGILQAIKFLTSFIILLWELTFPNKSHTFGRQGLILSFQKPTELLHVIFLIIPRVFFIESVNLFQYLLQLSNAIGLCLEIPLGIAIAILNDPRLPSYAETFISLVSTLHVNSEICQFTIADELFNSGF